MGKSVAAIDICNRALDEIGEKAISSITSPSTVSEAIVARHYDDTRSYLLETNTWDFAVKRVQLPRNAVDPLFGYSDAYDLPFDYIRPVSIFSDYYGSYAVQPKDFTIENGQILIENSGGTSLDFTYVFDEVSVGNWPSSFKRLLVLYLALELAYAFTKKNNIVQRVEQQIQLHEQKIRSIEGQKNPPKRYERSKWINVRRAAGRRYATSVIDAGAR